MITTKLADYAGKVLYGTRELKIAPSKDFLFVGDAMAKKLKHLRAVLDFELKTFEQTVFNNVPNNKE